MSHPVAFLFLLILALGGCRGTRPVAGETPFPPTWWRPVPEADAASWEILPQAAGPGEVILSKRNELGLLSNFAATPFTYHGRRYASVEGFWQCSLYPEGPNDVRARAHGTTWAFTRDQVAAMTAFEAKRAGDLAKKNMEIMGIDWNSFEGRRMTYRAPSKGDWYVLIKDVLRAKLDQNPNVREVLLRTGTLRLLPDHHQDPNAPPAWRYFEIWMEIRDELRRPANQAGSSPTLSNSSEGTPVNANRARFS